MMGSFQKVKGGIISVFVSCMLISGCSDKKKQIQKGEGDEVKQSSEQQKPNVIVIYTDDLGYGDLSCYGAKHISTPNIDKLANSGLRFTDGHASSATCTPSRYALLTGTYPWRNKRAHILPGTAPLVIDTNQKTLPGVLRKNGYHTGIVGKWHLGLGTGIIDWNKRVSPGPNEVGFDYSYIMAATQDRVPTVYIENGNVVNLDESDPILVDYQKNFEGEPTGEENPEMLKLKWHHEHNNSIVNGIPRIGYMKGGKSALWKDEDMAYNFLNKACSYVTEHKDEPFFLYYAMQQPHVPRTPHPDFVGKSGMGPRGDVILEADWCIGQFIDSLESLGLLENTLIVFSSDNGPVLNDGYYDSAIDSIGEHTPNGVYRGGKYSLFEAGTRVPFFTYWKGKISPGVSEALVSQIDIMNSINSLLGINEKSGDGKNMIKTFTGEAKTSRSELVLEATGGKALRKGDYVYIPPQKGQPKNWKKNIETGFSMEPQLYNLKEDPQQQNNLATTDTLTLNKMAAIYLEVTQVK